MWQSFWSACVQKSVRRRLVRHPVGDFVEQIEPRLVLSHVAGIGSRATPVDFSGNWVMQTPSGPGTLDIQHDTESIHAAFSFPIPEGPLELEFQNRPPRGDVLKLKARGEIGGEKASAKVKATLTNPNEMSGTIRVKFRADGINTTVTYTATR